MGGTTPTSGNAAGSMDSWQVYNQQLQQQQQQNQIGSAVGKGIGQLGSGIAEGSKATPSSASVPSVPTMAMPPIAAQQQGQGIDIMDALNRILGRA